MSLISILSERFDVEVLTESLESNEIQTQTQILPHVTLTTVKRKKPSFFDKYFPPTIFSPNPKLEAVLQKRWDTQTLLWVSRLKMAAYIPKARSFGYRVILDEQNVEASLNSTLATPKMQTLWKAFKNLPFKARMGYLRERYCSACHCVVASSSSDAIKLNRLVPHVPSQVVPNFLNTLDYEKTSHLSPTPQILFPGTLDFEPNLRGLWWFSEEVLPRLRRALGGNIPPVIAAGARPSDKTIERLHTAGIQVIPNPKSMIPILQQASIVVLPSEGLSVNRMSILEAMACGKPVVTTGEGIEGLQVSPTYDVLVADQEDAFASAILRLLRESVLSDTLGKQARDTVKQFHSPEAIRPALERVLKSVGFGEQAGLSLGVEIQK